MNLNRLTFFAAVIETGSFTAAAKRLGVGKALVSHQIARLEEEIGLTLISRTTRRLAATEHGGIFYERSAALLHDAEAAYAELTANVSEPTGKLTITTTADYGRIVLAPAVAVYLARYPRMQVDMAFEDAKVDLIAAHVDISVRVGWLSDSSRQSRRIGGFEQYLVAASHVAQSLASDVTPQTISSIPFVENRALAHPATFVFTQGGQKKTVQFAPSLTTDQTAACHACVLEGAGAGVFPDYLVEPDLAEGRLVRLMPDWSLPSGGIYIVYPAARFRPAKVKAFVDILLTTEQKRGRPSACPALESL